MATIVRRLAAVFCILQVTCTLSFDEGLLDQPEDAGDGRPDATVREDASTPPLDAGECFGGLTWCTDRCVNLTTDANNCGECENACAGHRVCCESACAVDCI